MDRKIHILLPVHNRIEVTRNFIRNLLKQTYKNFQLILIDDGSIDGTSSMVKSLVPEVKILYGNGNLWWAGSLQKGYDWVKSHLKNRNDLVLIINDDTEFKPDFLEIGEKLMMNNELLVARCLDIKTDKLIDEGTYIDWKNLKFVNSKDNYAINCLSTRGLFLTVDNFLNIGGFYPKLLPHYFSDYEYTHRAFKQGLKLNVDKKLYLFLNAETTGYRKLWNENLVKSIRNLFSKKSPMNPVYYTMFIILACPLKYKLINVIRVWYRFLPENMLSFISKKILLKNK